MAPPTPKVLASDVYPFHPVEWRSTRTRLHWWYVARDGACFLAQHHDDPLPAARVYGYDDNDPVQVTLAPDASVYASRFGHDVLVTSAVPIGWHRAGEVDVAAFARDPHRAIFFAQSPAHAERRASAGAHLDAVDARDLAPAVVLGPDERARYAVDLTFAVHRIVATTHGPDNVTHVGGPGAGFAVFDADHRVVRRGSGRLLGGWFRWATIEEGGHYWREDLATGERMRLAHADSPPSAGAAVDVLAIPGARNVLLVTEGHLRVV